MTWPGSVRSLAGRFPAAALDESFSHIGRGLGTFASGLSCMWTGFAPYVSCGEGRGRPVVGLRLFRVFRRVVGVVPALVAGDVLGLAVVL